MINKNLNFQFSYINAVTSNNYSFASCHSLWGSVHFGVKIFCDTGSRLVPLLLSTSAYCMALQQQMQERYVDRRNTRLKIH